MTRKTTTTITNCEVCKKDMALPLWLSKATRFCSQICSGESNHLRKQKKVSCKTCSGEFSVCISRKQKFCSHKCYAASLEGKIVFIGGHKGHTHTEQWKESMRGENNPGWIKDRSKLSGANILNDRRTYAYAAWRKEVWVRDNWACKMKNSECNGRIEAHHILSYTNFPELRYDLNNGITLCHFHHPRKRIDENRLSPYFRDLINKTI